MTPGVNMWRLPSYRVDSSGNRIEKGQPARVATPKPHVYRGCFPAGSPEAVDVLRRLAQNELARKGDVVDA